MEIVKKVGKNRIEKCKVFYDDNSVDANPIVDSYSIEVYGIDKAVDEKRNLQKQLNYWQSLTQEVINNKISELQIKINKLDSITSMFDQPDETQKELQSDGTLKTITKPIDTKIIGKTL